MADENEENKINKKINDLDERSDQVREILGRAPAWVIRWGITVIFIIVIFVLIGSALISYNDVLSSNITITTQNPPVYLDARSTGRLTNIFVEANQSVKEGDVLAEIENTADLEDVYKLKNRLENFQAEIQSTEALNTVFPTVLELGPVQLSYGNFLTQYQSYILYNSNQPNKKESIALSGQINQLKNQLRQQQEQLKLFENELEFSNRELERNRELFKKGVISESEFDAIRRTTLSDRSRYETFKSAITNTQSSIINNNSSLTRTNIQGEELSVNNSQALLQAYLELNNQILNWEQTYILKSPIDGKITIFDIWNKNQNVNVGETLFTIVPDNYENIIGKLNVPIRNSGKIEVGQRVIIKLENYPNQEWGSLKGEIVNISDVPKKDNQQGAFYSIYVNIASLTTSYDKEIEFKQEMQGTAEIVLEELSIMERIFYQIRSLFDE